MTEACALHMEQSVKRCLVSDTSCVCIITWITVWTKPNCWNVPNISVLEMSALLPDESGYICDGLEIPIWQDFVPTLSYKNTVIEIVKKEMPIMQQTFTLWRLCGRMIYSTLQCIHAWITKVICVYMYVSLVFFFLGRCSINYIIAQWAIVLTS